MLPVVREWGLSLSRAAAVICGYSAAALEAIVVVSQCSEILLSVALLFTNSLAFYLSAMLRLNASVRSTLAGLLFSLEEGYKHGHSSSTWLSSHTSRNSSCSSQSWGGRGRGRRRAAKCLKMMLKTVPAIWRRSLFICTSIAALFTSSPLCSDFRPGNTTMNTLCGCTSRFLSALQTVTSISTQVLGIVWDLSTLISRMLLQVT